jgi:hypothetical protein
MKHLLATAVLANILAFALLLAAAYATPPWQTPQTYQVKGPVLELTADMIVVKKGNARWEIARNAAVMVKGDVKVGATVTIEYRMTAVSIDVK